MYVWNDMSVSVNDDQIFLFRQTALLTHHNNALQQIPLPPPGLIRAAV